LVHRPRPPSCCGPASQPPRGRRIRSSSTSAGATRSCWTRWTPCGGAFGRNQNQKKEMTTHRRPGGTERSKGYWPTPPGGTAGCPGSTSCSAGLNASIPSLDSEGGTPSDDRGHTDLMGRLFPPLGLRHLEIALLREGSGGGQRRPRTGMRAGTPICRSRPVRPWRTAVYSVQTRSCAWSGRPHHRLMGSRSPNTPRRASSPVSDRAPRPTLPAVYRSADPAWGFKTLLYEGC
jgi:hypothetical protein